ncbi:MAG: hypothetical protein IJ512_00715 [Ruminococcus sp.]|nr:hypothetical protein [Ruminococcus sp.]
MMKKYTCVLLAAMLALSLCGCSRDLPAEDSVTAAETTATTLVSHYLRAEYLYRPVLSELCEHSAYVAEGTIQTAEITVIKGITFDVLEISITESHYGDLAEGDVITVYTNHGLEDFPAPAAGESYLCFLNDAGDICPEGTYEAVMGHACSFFVRSEETYTNYFTAEVFQRTELEAALLHK